MRFNFIIGTWMNIIKFYNNQKIEFCKCKILKADYLLWINLLWIMKLVFIGLNTINLTFIILVEGMGCSFDKN